LLEFFDRNIEKESCSRWDRLQIPDMSHRSCELDVSSTLAPDLRSRDFYATSFTDYTFVADTLILTTCTLIVLAWAKDLFTEESSTFWALGSVVDRLRDEDFTIGKCTDIFL
jgi:hypothetical protein